MSKTMAQWQLEIAHAANAKYPNNSQWSVYDRLISIQEQLDDVVAAIKVEARVLQSEDHAHQDPNHRIAALIADILILCQSRNVDTDAELERVLDWFKGNSR